MFHLILTITTGGRYFIIPAQMWKVSHREEKELPLAPE